MPLLPSVWGGSPPSDYGIHATSTATNTTLICNWAVHSAVNLLNLLYARHAAAA